MDMISPRLILMLLVAPIAFPSSSAAIDTHLPPSPQKTLTLNGEAVHDNGAVGLNVTNFGLLGSRPGSSAPYSSAPSLRYPLPSGADHLWAAGVWVGGTVSGIAHVSTGQFHSEFLADPDDPIDTIYASSEGAPAGMRLPGVADDDNDGQVDEDPLNGVDDDGDGAIDEDFAAIGNQYFHAQMRDDVPLLGQTLPDHNPMHLALQQESFSWSDNRVDDLVGFRYSVRNAGAESIDNAFLGVFTDFDISPTAEYDLFGFESFSKMSELSDDPVDVQLAYMYDAEGGGSYAGIVLLNHTAADGQSFAGSRGMQAFVGHLPFDVGGDPVIDAERYDMLARNEFDPAPLPSQVSLANDYRLLLTAGPFGQLAPGAQVVFEFAFVMGTDLNQLRANAANAVALARGQYVEYGGGLVLVPWLLPSESTVPVLSASLTGQWSAVGAKLRVGRSADFPIQLLRLSQVGLPERTWSDDEARVSGPWLRFLDEDQGPWPRDYLVQFQSRELTRTRIDRPGDKSGHGDHLRDVQVFPNSFNPQTEIRFVLGERSQTRVEIFDSRGQRVRLLHSGSLETGQQRIHWDGTDSSGRDVATGIYFVRVSTEDREITQRAALVR